MAGKVGKPTWRKWFESIDRQTNLLVCCFSGVLNRAPALGYGGINRSMSNRIKITCGSCTQALVVDAASAGKQVRCPKCQSLSVIPQSNLPNTGNLPGPAVAAGSATKVVACPTCQTRLSVRVLATDANPRSARSVSRRCRLLQQSTHNQPRPNPNRFDRRQYQQSNPPLCRGRASPLSTSTN